MVHNQINMNLNIDDLLNKVPDKFENRWTTSKKFKIDLFETFDVDEFKEKTCAELGVFNGHTTLFLCHLFKHVTGIDLGVDRLKFATQLLESNNITNFKMYNVDLYKDPFPDLDGTDVFFIDAVHEYENVKIDTLNCLKVKSKSKKYIVYDDYGGIPAVKKAVDELINTGLLTIYKKIGCEPKSKFTRELFDYEGIICIEK